MMANPKPENDIGIKKPHRSIPSTNAYGINRLFLAYAFEIQSMGLWIDLP